jgi:hypothetical protein
MSNKGHFFNPPVKLKTFKRDLSPIGFFFDFFNSDIFNIPVMPLPMRIDRISNGKSTYFIKPDLNKINSIFKELRLTIDFNLFFTEGFKNLIRYTRKTYKEVIHRELKNQLIKRWFETSLQIQPESSIFQEDFTLLMTEFLYLYYELEKQKNHKTENNQNSLIIQYCEKMIKHFQKIIENNRIQIKNTNGEIETKKLYKEKKNKFYPEIISLDIRNIKDGKIKQLNFVPFLIYEDLLDVFWFNNKVLKENSLKVFDFRLWKENRIINKRSNIDNFISKIDLNKIDVERLL